MFKILQMKIQIVVTDGLWTAAAHLHLPPHNVKWVGACLRNDACQGPEHEHQRHRQPLQRNASAEVANWLDALHLANLQHFTNLIRRPISGQTAVLVLQGLVYIEFEARVGHNAQQRGPHPTI